MKKKRRFSFNGPSLEMQAAYHNGKISAARLIEHCEERQKRPGA